LGALMLFGFFPGLLVNKIKPSVDPIVAKFSTTALAQVRSPAFRRHGLTSGRGDKTQGENVVWPVLLAPPNGDTSCGRSPHAPPPEIRAYQCSSLVSQDVPHPSLRN